MSSDTAIEAALGLIATGGSVPPAPGAMEKFVELLKLAEAALSDAGSPLDVRLREKLLRVHRTRNNSVHAGAIPADSTVVTAVDTARQIVAVTASTSPLLARISGVGPVQAVAELVGVKTIQERLVAASDALSRGDPIAAADSAAIALYETLRRLDPPLRPRLGGRIPRGQLATIDRYRQSGVGTVGIDEISRPLEDHANLMEAWLLALAVGLRPNELRDLRTDLGYVSYYLSENDNVQVRREPGVELTAAMVERRLLMVASIVFRLVANGELRLLEPWEASAPPAPLP